MSDFGYADVPLQNKQSMVLGVFNSVATNYDVMNDFMSAGMHRLWKRHLVNDMLRPFAGQKHIDVAGGTGDVAVRVARAILDAERAEGLRAAKAGAAPTSEKNKAKLGQVTVVDINAAMLAEGRRRAINDASLDDVCRSTYPVLRADEEGYTEGNAETLDGVPDESMDSYTIAFGMRNVPRRDLALAAAHRVLKPGGRFLCMEFSPHVWVSLGSKQPPYALPPITPSALAAAASNLPFVGPAAAAAANAAGAGSAANAKMVVPSSPTQAAELLATSVMQLGYDAYSFGVVPSLGAAVAGDAESYQYLVESIRRFPDATTFSEMVRAAGFVNVRVTPLTGGIVAVHSAIKL